MVTEPSVAVIVTGVAALTAVVWIATFADPEPWGMETVLAMVAAIEELERLTMEPPEPVRPFR
jgi:hypothetical protein